LIAPSLSCCLLPMLPTEKKLLLLAKRDLLLLTKSVQRSLFALHLQILSSLFALHLKILSSLFALHLSMVSSGIALHQSTVEEEEEELELYLQFNNRCALYCFGKFGGASFSAAPMF